MGNGALTGPVVPRPATRALCSVCVGVVIKLDLNMQVAGLNVNIIDAITQVTIKMTMHLQFKAHVSEKYNCVGMQGENSSI